MTDAESEKRFEGAGQEFHAKYMGCVEVAKSKGQEVCQEAMQKLLVALKARKDPKPRLIINLTYEGTQLKEMPPGINLLEMTFKHSQVSYVWKDPRDQRSLGIVRSEADPADPAKFVHKFHGIRTIKPAMPFLQDMQELFRIVKERSAQQKERSASVAASAASENGTAVSAAAPTASQPQPLPQPTDTDDARDRAVSNLLGPDQSDTSGQAGLPKNASVASLDDLGDIFSASATIGQQPQSTLTSQPMEMNGGPFAQQMVGGPFSQPMGAGGSTYGQQMGAGGSPFGPPMGAGGSPFGPPTGAGGSPFGPPMGAGGSPFGPPMGAGGSPYGQPMGAVGSPFGQPMGAGNSPFGQPMPGAQYRPPLQQPQSTNPFGQQPVMPGATNPYSAPVSPFGRPGPPAFGQPPQQQPLFYQQPPQQAARQPPPSTNPFASGFSSVFDRQNSVPAGGTPEDLLTPVTLNPVPVNPLGSVAKPDAFSDLVLGLPVADPKRQQVSGKDLFKPIDKTKATLRDLANQSPRP